MLTLLAYSLHMQLYTLNHLELYDLMQRKYYMNVSSTVFLENNTRKKSMHVQYREVFFSNIFNMQLMKFIDVETTDEESRFILFIC